METNVPVEHKAWIDRWFWRSALSERYAKSQNTQMANDAKAIRELIGGRVELPNYPLTVRKDDIRKMRINHASGARNAILCLLAHAKPKHFVTGNDIALAKDHFSNIKERPSHFSEDLPKEGSEASRRRGPSPAELLFSTGRLKQ